MLKVGTAALVLEMIESGVAFRDFSLDNPIRAIREVSHDLTGRRPVRLAGGRQASALDIQREYSRAGRRTPADPRTQRADRAGRRPVGPSARRRREPGLRQGRHRDRLGDQAQAVPALPGPLQHGAVRSRRSPSSTWPTTTSNAAAGVFDLLQRKGLAARITTDEEIEEAVDTPPQTTRAKLRGEFISAAQEAGRDFTVDWVHLKLNDQAQRTVLCKDPFRSVDERVKRLIASM